MNKEEQEAFDALVKASTEATVLTLKAAGHIPDEAEIKQIKADLVKAVAKAEDFDTLKTNVDAQLKAAEEKFAEYEEMKTKFPDLVAKMETQHKELGELAAKLQDGPLNNKAPIGIGGMVKEFLATKTFGEMADGKSKHAYLDFDQKDIDFGTSVQGAGNVVQPFQTGPTVTFVPEKPFDIRSIMAPISSNQSNVSFTKEKTYIDGVAVLAENAASTATDTTLEEITVNSVRIATNTTISRRALKNTSFLQRHVTDRIGTKLSAELTEQVLNGDGTGENMSGLFVNATVFTPGTFATGQDNEVTTPNLAGLLTVVKARLEEVNNVVANIAFLNPKDTVSLMLTKNTVDNDYLNLEVILSRDQNGIMRINGMPLVQTHFVAADDYLVADLSSETAELLVFENFTMRLAEDHSDNAVKNKVTFVFESEWILPVYANFRMLKGTIVADIASIKAA